MTHYIPQADINSSLHSIKRKLNQFHSPNHDENHISRRRQDNFKETKKKPNKGPFLVNANFREVVEMSYWLIKFVGQFGKEYRNNHALGKTEDDLKIKSRKGETLHSELFTKNTAMLISYARFFLKFLGSFEKLYKSV